MHRTTPRAVKCPKSRPLRTVLVLLALGAGFSGEILAQTPGLITPNPEREGIPPMRNQDVRPKPLDSAAPAPDGADYVLPSEITRIDLKTAWLASEIEAVLRPFVGQKRISVRELEQAQGLIWNLYRENGRLARVQLGAIPRLATEGGSVLQADVSEMRVRSFTVVQEGEIAVSESLRQDILASARADIAEGGALDMDRLDSRIKRRMFLGDVNVRASLVPVDAEQVDVRIVLNGRPAAPVGFLLHYDNYGLKTYGQHRLTAGVSTPSRLIDGDQIDLVAITTKGTDYHRLAYEFPVVPLGARLSIWDSRLRYRVPAVANGKTGQTGVGMVVPLHVTQSASWMGHLDYVSRHQADQLANNTPAGDKRIRNLVGKVDVNYFPDPAQSVRLEATLTHGRLDLSSLPAALAQDRNSADANGTFNKLEWNGIWTRLFGPQGQFDARLSAKGQFASKNLDQSEKLALGGPVGVRAFGASEALGDEGQIVNAEIGYRANEWLRLYSFYDQGHIRRNRNPWAAEAIPQAYTLRGAGIGVAFSHQSVVGALTFARQIGSNPGLSAAGLDAEGLRKRHRIWLSMTVWL